MTSEHRRELAKPQPLGEHVPVRMFASVADRIGRPRHVELSSLLANPHVLARKSDGGLAVWATTNGQGCDRASLVASTANTFDLDSGCPAFDDVVSRVHSTGIAAWVHTTSSHRSDAPRCRVIVPFLAPIPPADALESGRALEGIFADAGLVVDPKARDYDTRKNYLPAIVAGGEYRWAHVEGEPAPVADLLEVRRIEREAEEHLAALAALRQARAASLRSPVGASAYSRALAYTATVPGAVSGQGGHAATFLMAARLIKGFALSDGEALDVLSAWNLTCLPPWTPRELARKVREAREKSTMPVGALLEARAS